MTHLYVLWFAGMAGEEKYIYYDTLDELLEAWPDAKKDDEFNYTF